MKTFIIFISILIISTVLAGFTFYSKNDLKDNKVQISKKNYWFVLHRKSGTEYLYDGVSGDINNSTLVKKFQVKTGAESSPTPLPHLVGRDYWKIVKKESSIDNPDTAPFFLQLDIPATEEWPYGPVPYEECKDAFGIKIQCDWILPGYFGLHGVGENDSKLSKEDVGSSGCIRHSNSDITYLYNLLSPEKEEIRYYIEDN